jgi:hypothetical protein
MFTKIVYFKFKSSLLYKVIQVAPLKKQGLAKVVSKTIRPVAGVAIKFFSAVVICGGRNPLVVELNSKIALAFSAVGTAAVNA